MNHTFSGLILGGFVEKALYGLSGIFIGFILSSFKEWWILKFKRKKEAEFLSVHVSFLLERFIEECAEIVEDDGLYHGQYNQEGCRQAHAKEPSLNLKSLDVDWKSLPSGLMYRILDLPNEIYKANKRISSVEEHVASPPDYEEIFEERQYAYAKLGLLAIKYVDELRDLGSLRKRGRNKHNPEKTLIDKRNEIESNIQLRESNKYQRGRLDK